MTTPADEIHVADVPTESRFVVRLDGRLARLDYRLQGDRLVLVHTEVPEELGGHGIGGRLVAAAVERAQNERLTLVPWCPFARKWLREHADTAASVTVDWESRPPSSD